jgi:monoamine oxidase
MDPQGRFNPLLDAFSSYYNGAEFDQISAIDYHAYEDSGSNWRLPAGYGALIQRLAPDQAEMHLETPVTRIDRNAGRLVIETPRGEIAARCAIVTVPTSLLAAGVFVIEPDLPSVREAAAQLPLGLADKVYLGLDEPEAFAGDGHLLGHPDRTETASYHLRPFGRPLIEAYLGGRNARTLEGEGHGAASAFVVEELVEILGSGVRATIHPLAETRWAHDPWSMGSYSHALPGGSWARAALAESGDPRLIFAGEALSPHAYSTAHGAFETGETAAIRALAHLRSVEG